MFYIVVDWYSHAWWWQHPHEPAIDVDARISNTGYSSWRQVLGKVVTSGRYLRPDLGALWQVVIG
jgi:hypothetical protein